MNAAAMPIPLDMIAVEKRLRDVEPAAVDVLAVSMEEGGQITPVVVRPGLGDPRSRGYRLVAGAHRIAAARKLGWTSIDAVVKHLTDDEALQYEIDENLVRRGLTPLERAEMIAARFAVWARLHPDRVTSEGEVLKPKRGRPKNSEKFSQFRSGAPATMGFAAETASEVGLTKRVIEHSLTIASMPADLRLRLRGTWIGKSEGVQRQLAGISDPALQAKAVEVLISGQTKSVPDALAYASGGAPAKAVPAPVSELHAAFDKLWKAATAADKAELLASLAARKLPGEWALIPSDAPEFAAWRARVAPPAGPGPDDFLEGFDDE